MLIIHLYNVNFQFLTQYPTPDSNLLKSSKIGKAVMLLYRHPKETKKNREKAGKLISELLAHVLPYMYVV